MAYITFCLLTLFCALNQVPQLQALGQEVMSGTGAYAVSLSHGDGCLPCHSIHFAAGLLLRALNLSGSEATYWPPWRRKRSEYT